MFDFLVIGNWSASEIKEKYDSTEAIIFFSIFGGFALLLSILGFFYGKTSNNENKKKRMIFWSIFGFFFFFIPTIGFFIGNLFSNAKTNKNEKTKDDNMKMKKLKELKNKVDKLEKKS